LNRHTELLGVFVHGALFFGHSLGAAHNALRGNRKWAAFHTAAALLDLYATGVHWKAAREA
jgi:hypothetical protein